MPYCTDGREGPWCWYQNYSKPTLGTSSLQRVSSPAGRSTSPQLPTSSEPMGQGWCPCYVSQDPAGSSLQSPQLLSLCSHSVPDHTFGSRCARRGGRLRHSMQTPLCPHAQSVSNLSASCLHCVTFGAGSAFSMVPKPVPAGCTESHQQLIC